MLAWLRQRPPAALIALSACLLLTGCPRATPDSPACRDCLFCFWNVENLFDDLDDARRKADEGYDNWYASNPDILRKKLQHLAAALLKLNGGCGPDILALAEVESGRAAALLRDELNRQLSDEALHYPHALMREVKVGRHIAPALITRLPVLADRTRQYSKNLRILETQLDLHGHPLAVVAAHWTSRVSDETGKQRARYADQIYGAFQAMYRANPGVDWLMAGDCNDPPEAPSLTRHLRASGDLAGVRFPAGQPLLFNLFAGKSAKEFGTLYHRGWHIYDSIVVSPGMLDETGWSCLPDTAHTVNGLYRPDDRGRKPWRFGTARDTGDRGTSDHFPVTVRLRVHPR